MTNNHKVLRHLDGGNNGLVEVKEVATAVRTIRRYESIIKAAKRCGMSPGKGSDGGGGGVGGLVRPPSPTSMVDGTVLFAGDSISGGGAILDQAVEKGWGGDDHGGTWGGTGDLWDSPVVSRLGCRMSSLEVGGGALSSAVRLSCRDFSLFFPYARHVSCRRFQHLLLLDT